MGPDAVYKLAGTREEILNKERKSWYLQAIGKLMHLFHIWSDIVFSVHKLAQFSSRHYLIHESALQRIFGYIKNGSIKLFWVPDKKMLADGFTKPLSRPAFEDKRARIGVVDIEKDD